MRLFTGTYKSLENHFLKEHLGKLKTPQERVLLIAPSQRLEHRLITKLTEQNGFTGGLHTGRFSSLAENINSAVKQTSKPLLPASTLQDFIIKDIAGKLPDINPSRGYRRALKAAFRDLIAAEVTAEDLVNIKNSEEFSFTTEKDILGNFIVCYDEYLKKLPQKGFFTYGEFFNQAVKNTPENPYLAQFEKIIFYGFYDFTALQYNLFKEICANFPAEVYFPYENASAYGFTKKFYESDIIPLAKDDKVILAPDSHPLAMAAKNIFSKEMPKTEGADIKIISVSGVQAEVQAAAKEILFLKEKLNIPFNQIAVFARSLEPYKYDIPVIFAQNKIPVNYDFELPLLNHPLAAFIYNLLSLGRNDFYKQDVCAVLISPYFAAYKKEWRNIILSSPVDGGLKQWENITCLNSRACNAEEYEQYSQEIVKTLADLNNFYKEFEQPAPFDELAKKTLKFLSLYVTPDLPEQEQGVFEQIQNITAQTGNFAKIRKYAAEGEFAEELLAAIKEAVYHKTASFENGVECGDIMALRGSSFKAAIFLGMNEGLMPATPAPDPVLKEEYRKALFKTGCQIHTQADRFWEEKLLFTFALSSVEQKAVFIFERSDNDGKDKIPSLYLSRIAQTAGKDLKKTDLVLSRRESEKLQAWPTEMLTQQEAASCAALFCPDSPALLWAAFNPENKEDKQLETMLAKAPFLRSASSGLSGYDGIIPQDNALYQKILKEGLSPSSLADLWKCPFKYLIKFIVNEEDITGYNRAEIPANEQGTLYHKILEQFYRYISQHNLTDKLFTAGAQDILDNIAQEFLAPDNYKKYGLYPVVWKVLTKQMKENLYNLVGCDIKELQSKKMYPAFFEHKTEAEADFCGRKLKLHGKIDRIDINPETKQCRITDYKRKEKDGSMLKLIFYKAVLQPPVYMEIIKNTAQKELAGLQPEELTLLSIETDKKPFKSFTAQDYAAIKETFSKILNYRLGLLQKGEMLITPSEDNCKYCPYEDICRKGHTPTLARAALAPQAKALKTFTENAVPKKRGKNAAE